jgi:hypothetical protein
MSNADTFRWFSKSTITADHFFCSLSLFPAGITSVSDQRCLELQRGHLPVLCRFGRPRLPCDKAMMRKLHQQTGMYLLLTTHALKRPARIYYKMRPAQSYISQVARVTMQSRLKCLKDWQPSMRSLMPNPERNGHTYHHPREPSKSV